MGWIWIILLPVLIGVPVVTFVNALVGAARRRPSAHSNRVTKLINSEIDVID